MKRLALCPPQDCARRQAHSDRRQRRPPGTSRWPGPGLLRRSIKLRSQAPRLPAIALVRAEPVFEHHEDPHHLAVVRRKARQMIPHQCIDEPRSQIARGRRAKLRASKARFCSPACRVSHTPNGSPKPCFFLARIAIGEEAAQRFLEKPAKFEPLELERGLEPEREIDQIVVEQRKSRRKRRPTPSQRSPWADRCPQACISSRTPASC